MPAIEMGTYDPNKMHIKKAIDIVLTVQVSSHVELLIVAFVFVCAATFHSILVHGSFPVKE